MRNRPTTVLAGQQRRGDAPWKVDEHPGKRLCWLFVIVCLPMIAVVVRVGWLQTIAVPRFTSSFEATSESFETIPSVDGRILAADGRVLAYDIVRFNVQMHYRWLEEPADDDWLHRHALSRLAPTDRRLGERVDAERAAILTERRQLWTQLAHIGDISLSELTAARADVQKRVERILQLVDARRREREADADRLSNSEQHADADHAWWRNALRRAMHSLTTPPRRTATEKLVIREQLEYHTVMTNVSRQVALEIESHPQQYPGVRIETQTERSYPERTLAAHVIGVRTPVDEQEVAARREQMPEGDPLDYQPNDRIGRSGIEKSYDRRLRGLRGLRRLVKNRRGEIIHSEIVREPRLGRDVVLTLNMPLQQRCEQLLDQAISAELDSEVIPVGGCVVAVDVHTGQMLAAAAAPRHDLQMVIHPTRDEWRQLINDPAQPMFPRVTQMTVAPGSVFKPLAAVALLEDGRIDPTAPLYCQGYLDTPNRHRCYIFRHFGRGHGDLSLNEALAQSCNVYFFSAARKMGPGPIVEWAHRFGLGRPTGVDIPGERGGNLPLPPELAEPSPSRRVWYNGDTLGLAIGQSRLTVTPLQMACVMAAIANDGYMITPRFVGDGGPQFGDNGQTNSAANVPRRIPGISTGTLAAVRDGLREVVANPRGTGYKQVRLAEVEIAGKTGTAEVAGKHDHAWFAGYVPADRPRIAFCVVLEHGGSGGAAAGPIARQFVESLLEFGILHPKQLAAQSTGDGLAPLR